MAASDSSYPGSLDIFTDKTASDWVNASDMNAVQDGLVAVMTELGADPAGSFDTVVLRLDDIDSDLGANAYGSDFPVSPSTGNRFFRTDLGWLCYYDGTRWLTIQEYAMHGVYQAASATTSQSYRVRTDYAMYVTRVAISTMVAATNDGTNNWTIAVQGINLTWGSASAILSFTTASDTHDVWTDHGGAPSTPNPTDRTYLRFLLTKNNSPGNLTIYPAIYYRLIVT